MAGTEMKGMTTSRLCLERTPLFTARLLAKLKESNADDEQKTALTLVGANFLTLSPGVMTISQLMSLTKIRKKRLKCTVATLMSSLLPLHVDCLFM
jgi:hypothetical protein